uniref:Uncharacterized protein n=1 Tax=Rhizophora mucronata TaxID=61149 RepID=A0A2P2N1W2_RHIMU
MPCLYLCINKNIHTAESTFLPSKVQTYGIQKKGDGFPSL